MEGSTIQAEADNFHREDILHDQRKHKERDIPRTCSLHSGIYLGYMDFFFFNLLLCQ